MLFETNSISHVSTYSNSLPLSGNNILCFDLYCFSVLELYKVLNQTDLKYPAFEKCVYFKSVNTRFFDLLLKKVSGNLQIIRNKIETKKQPSDFKDHYLTSIFASSQEATVKKELELVSSFIEQFTNLAKDNQELLGFEIEKAKQRLNLLQNTTNLTCNEIEILKSFGKEMEPFNNDDHFQELI